MRCWGLHIPFLVVTEANRFLQIDRCYCPLRHIVKRYQVRSDDPEVAAFPGLPVYCVSKHTSL